MIKSRSRMTCSPLTNHAVQVGLEAPDTDIQEVRARLIDAAKVVIVVSQRYVHKFMGSVSQETAAYWTSL